MFDYTIETNKNIDEAILSLEQNLKEEKFGILWQFDIKEKLQEKGLDFDQVRIPQSHDCRRDFSEFPIPDDHTTVGAKICADTICFHSEHGAYR